MYCMYGMFNRDLELCPLLGVRPLLGVSAFGFFTVPATMTAVGISSLGGRIFPGLADNPHKRSAASATNLTSEVNSSSC